MQRSATKTPRKRKVDAHANQTATMESTPAKKPRVYKPRAKKSIPKAQKVAASPRVLHTRGKNGGPTAEALAWLAAGEENLIAEYVESSGVGLTSVRNNLDEYGSEVLDMKLDDDLARSYEVARKEVSRAFLQESYKKSPKNDPEIASRPRNTASKQILETTNEQLRSPEQTSHAASEQPPSLTTHHRVSKQVSALPTQNAAAGEYLRQASYPNAPSQAVQHDYQLLSPRRASDPARGYVVFDWATHLSRPHETHGQVPAQSFYGKLSEHPRMKSSFLSMNNSVAPTANMQMQTTQNPSSMTGVGSVEQSLPQGRKLQQPKLPSKEPLPSLETIRSQAKVLPQKCYIPADIGSTGTLWKLSSMRGLWYDASDRAVTITKFLAVREYLVAPSLNAAYVDDRDVIAGINVENTLLKFGGYESKVEPLISHKEGLALIDEFFGGY